MKATLVEDAARLTKAGIAFSRFGPPVRPGMSFRRKFEAAKAALGAAPFEWYRYDSFPNLFYMQHLLKCASQSLDEVIGNQPILDIGAADGALSFFFESIGYRVDAVDCSASNINRMQGIHAIGRELRSAVQVLDLDLDTQFRVAGQYGLALFLGTLYHLKNPFYVLEALAGRAQYCFLSTRIARLSPDGCLRWDQEPVAYLLEPGECNDDETNYFIFSPCGLEVLVKRAGWVVRAAASAGSLKSDPVSRHGDERMFLLLQSVRNTSA